MTQIIGIIFMACVIIAFIIENKKSSKQFYEERIKKLESDIEWQKQVTLSQENEFKLLKYNSACKEIALTEGIKTPIHEKDITEELENKAYHFINRKTEQLGKDVTLEDLIKDSIERNGKDSTKKLYLVIVQLMKVGGKDVSAVEEVFNKYFKKT